MLIAKKNFVHNPVFWFLFLILSLAAMGIAYHFFPKAFPIVDLTITVDRADVLKRAQNLATVLHSQPEVYHQAISFEADNEVKTFVELEAGGPQALKDLIKEGFYNPYFWKVRHFKEYDAHETELFFTPQGIPYAFVQKIPEDEAGAALTSDDALEKAMSDALTYWNVNFKLFKLVERGHETTSNERIDHTFVFEREDKKVGEAPYRLKLVIKGDLLSELKLSIKVPQSFKKKYEEMRSSNNFIAFIALIAMLILYLFLGCFFGLLYLVRNSFFVTKWAMIWALIISALHLLNDINQIPLIWMYYDTALSMQQYIGHLVLQMVYHFLMYFSLSFLLISVAEGLTRRAFPHHIQFWKLWTMHAGSSLQVLGRTLAGYLFVGFDCVYCIIFYYLAFKYLRWWSPSDTLYNPNELATYMPWLSPLASSLSAGFLEECGFRALPLAGAALLGERFGKKNVWMICAFILQAIIFGAAHANYPAQPAYARLIELIIPSFGFGFLYLRYGLLPAILSHFVYDVFWFSIPIFVTHASSMFIDKILVISICLVPILILFVRRMQNKEWVSLPSLFYNSAWQPKLLFKEHHEEIFAQSKIVWSQKKNIVGYLLGFVGLALLFAFIPTQYDTIPLTLQRTDALNFVRKNVDAKIANEPWTWLASVETPLESNERNQHIYIWRTFGKEMYCTLLKNYLRPELFKVRLARFSGSIDERAEEYAAYVDNTQKFEPSLSRLHHIIPEDKVYDAVSKSAALDAAYAYIQKHYNLSQKDLVEISAIPSQFQNGLTWKLTFQDKNISLEQGQARIMVEIAGKDIADAQRFIFVPESWDRMFKDETAFIAMFELWRLLLFVIFVASAVVIILSSLHSFPKTSWKMFFIIAVFLLTKSLLQAINIWPIVSAGFVTSQPFNHQATSMILFWLVYAFFIAIGSGLCIGFLLNQRFKSQQVAGSFIRYIIFGLCFGLLCSGFFVALKHFFVATCPQWPIYTYAAASLPWLSQGLSMLSSYVEYTLFALIIFTALDYISVWSGKFSWALMPCMMLFGFAVVESHSGLSWMSVMGIGIVWGLLLWILYYNALRHLRAVIPMSCAVIKIVEVMPKVIFHAYPGVALGWILGVVLVGSLAFIWSFQLYSQS